NTRPALHDAIPITDTHRVLRGGRVAAAVRAARAAAPGLPLEVECRTLGEVEEAVAAAPDLILLDNMSLAGLAEAVRLVAGRVPLEASGGIGLEHLHEVAATGVDYVA